MILKIVLVIGVIALVYFMFFKSKPLKKPETKRDKGSDEKPNDMVACATCEVYTEITECILSDGKYYCSTECIAKAK